MRALLASNRHSGALLRRAAAPSITLTTTALVSLLSSSHSRPLSTSRPVDELSRPRGLFSFPWFAIQHRGLKIQGSEVRPGMVIQRKGKNFHVIKAQHTQQGRGGASIQLELRDVDSGNKTNERLRTDEPIETVLVEGKSYTYLYTEGNSAILMEPETFEQIEVPKDLFGKGAVYLKEEMTVKVGLYDEKVMTASIPIKVVCTVKEGHERQKGSPTAPQNSKVLLENGLTVDAPHFIVSGDKIEINTLNDSYLTRVK